MENSKLKEELEYMIAISKMRKESDITMKNKKNIMIKRGIGIVACFAVIFSGIVYAKDIENYFKKIFNNSTEAIDKAIENNYVQEENMNYTYDKDIGIKVDSLVLDDLNLDISFNFEIKKDNIKSIRFKDFIITNDNDKVIFRSEFKYAETIDELPLYNSLTWINKPIKLTDTTYADSILFGLRPKKEDFQKLYFDIKSVQIIYIDDTQEIIDGSWKFDLEISEEMRTNTNITYTLLEKNEYVESAIATLSPTGMIVELNLCSPFDSVRYIEENMKTLDDTGLFYLKYNNEFLLPSYIDAGDMKYTIHYDGIGAFFYNINELEIYLKPFDSMIHLNKN